MNSAYNNIHVTFANNFNGILLSTNCIIFSNSIYIMLYICMFNIYIFIANNFVMLQNKNNLSLIDNINKFHYSVTYMIPIRLHKIILYNISCYIVILKI